MVLFMVFQSTCILKLHFAITTTVNWVGAREEALIHLTLWKYLMMNFVIWFPLYKPLIDGCDVTIVALSG
jgi:hypothetical protein